MATCMPRRPNGPRSPRGWRPRNYWLGTMAPSGAPHEVPAGGADPYANCGLPYHLGGEIRARDALILARPRSQARAWRCPPAARATARGPWADGGALSLRSGKAARTGCTVRPGVGPGMFRCPGDQAVQQRNLVPRHQHLRVLRGRCTRSASQPHNRTVSR